MKLLMLLPLCSILFSFSTKAALSYEEFSKVKEALYLSFEEMSRDNLSINLPIEGLPETYWWDIDMVHASYVRVESEERSEVDHRIYLMGGYARLKNMDPDGLANTACHEIGHGIAGGVRKLPSLGLPGNALEAEADYFSTNVCLPIVLTKLERMREYSKDPYFQKICEKQDKHSYEMCLRIFTALESEASFFTHLEQKFSFKEHSKNIATEINREPTYYPEVQCRIDTLIHGALDLERPICWFPNGAANGSFRDEI